MCIQIIIYDNNDCCNVVGYGPYTLGKVGCLGTEKSLFECPVSTGLCDAQFSSGDAGVLCYTVRSKCQSGLSALAMKW